MEILKLFRNRKKEEAPITAKERELILPEAARIIAVGGGKGGVGKSMVAANFGVLLAARGKRVLMVDADLGAANLHTLFGVRGSSLSLSGYLKGEINDFNNLATLAGPANLYIISGDSDSLDASSCDIARLIEAVSSADYDYVVLDIGPGTSNNNLDLFLACDHGMLVTTPDPTSVENSYRFLKCLLLRRIRNIINSNRDTRLKAILQEIFSGDWSMRIKTVAEIIDAVRSLDPDRGGALSDLMAETSLSILVNQTRYEDDSGLGKAMSKACRAYFGIDIKVAGNIPYEEEAAQSIRLKKPLVTGYPESSAAHAIKACLDGIVIESVRARHGCF